MIVEVEVVHPNKHDGYQEHRVQVPACGASVAANDAVVVPGISFQWTIGQPALIAPLLDPLQRLMPLTSFHK